VKFSTKIRYGLRAMITIAIKGKDDGVLQKDIAADQDISLKYLDHIINALKVSRLIKNTRGRKSGYILTKDPGSITVYDIHNAFEPGLNIVECLEDKSCCQRTSRCATRDFWSKLNNLLIDNLKSKTLADLVEEQLNYDSVSAD